MKTLQVEKNATRVGLGHRTARSKMTQIGKDGKMNWNCSTYNQNAVFDSPLSNTDMRDELERTIAHYVNIAIKEAEEANANELQRKMDAPYDAPSVRTLIKKNKNALLFKYFLEDVIVEVYATTHLYKRIMEREVNKEQIKRSILEMEDHMKNGNLLDRHNGHDFVIKNHRLHMSVAGYSFLADSGMKLVLSTCLHHPYFYEKPWAEAIEIR